MKLWTRVIVAVTPLVIGAISLAAELSPDHTTWSRPVFAAAYRLVATPDEMGVLDTLSAHMMPEFLARFWKKRDPTPTTDRNEFKVQFEERVSEALVRFRTVPVEAPWDERGDVLIRFGAPDDRQLGVDTWYSPEALRRGFYQIYSRGTRKSQVNPVLSREVMRYSDTAMGEIWYYNSRNLKLQFQSMGQEYRLVPTVSQTGEAQHEKDFAAMVREIKTAPVTYRVPSGCEELALAVDCYPFRRTDGDYDVYVASAAPLNAVAEVDGWKALDVDFTTNVIAFDSTLRVMWSDTTHVERYFGNPPRHMLAQTQWDCVLPPGPYIFAAEINTAGKKHGVGSFDRWLVPYIDSAQLELSPLVVAADVRPATDSSSSFVRNGKEIIPMPGHVFKNDQDVAFYHEVYNLTQNDSGVCSYRIVYAVYDSHNERAVLTAQNFHSRERNTFQAGHIPAAKLGKGKHILEVKTTDLITGVTKTALAGLKIE